MQLQLPEEHTGCEIESFTVNCVSKGFTLHS